jgi:trigger factor
MEMRSAGISDAEIHKRMRLLEQDTIQSTALALKEHFVLQKIAELENLEVTEDDINEEIERLAAQTDESPRRLRARLEKEELLESLATELVERKALDLVLQHAEYEDVPIRAEEVEQPALATVEEQAVPGEMKEPAAEEPAAEAEGESDAGASAPAS